MSEFAALALYPLWAVAAAVGFTALRLGRAAGLGLPALCLSLALWVTGLILLVSPGATSVAEHVLPSGMLLAAAFVHAGADVTGLSRRSIVWLTYAACAAVAVVGLIAPGLLYGPGARSPGPLFWPLAAVCVVASACLIVWLARSALSARGPERIRRAALSVACLIGSLAGGGVIGLRMLGVADVHAAAPLLLVAVALATYAVSTQEKGRARVVLQQGFAYALITAGLSAIGLTVFFHVLPGLTPHAGGELGWLVLVTFFAALPLDPLRQIVVDKAGRWLFRNPIGVRDLAEQVERQEVRADHAERLAEIGKLASAVAHEMRNPLGVIAAQAKLLERKGADAESVAALRTQVERAKKFLDDLLRYSKPRPLELTEVEILPALELVATNVRHIIGEGAPRIDVVLASETALFAEADRGAFNDVATVLVGNAVIATEGRTEARIRVTAERCEGSIVVTVEDNGPGVPPEIEATLFQPFVTGRGRDASHPGTGLGLAIATRWIERHGGTITYTRAAEGGACFRARWPRSTGYDGA